MQSTSKVRFAEIVLPKSCKIGTHTACAQTYLPLGREVSQVTDLTLEMCEIVSWGLGWGREKGGQPIDGYVN